MTTEFAIRPIIFAGLLGCFALLATGCSPATKVVGTWNVDYSQGIPSDFTKANQGLASTLLLLTPPIDVVFEGTGAYRVSGTFMGQKGEQKGTWRFLKMDGNTLILMVKPTGKADESELRMTFNTDNDHAEISMPMNLLGQQKSASLNFVRAKPK